jgi:prepilin-type N-terminal cleavage/methylation domain-containing protein
MRRAAPSPAATRRRAGFTLVEVLLTLLIMAGIMVTISQILTGARASRDAIHNLQESQGAGPAILAQIERDLRALFVYDRDAANALRIQDKVLSGFDADTLDFVCTTDSLLPWRRRRGEDFRRADYNEVGYRFRVSPTSDDFLELWRREGFGIDDDPFEGGRFALLHDRIKSFNIEIFTKDGPEADPVESWGTPTDEERGLPARIEITLAIELAPRLVREQLRLDRRTMEYRRVFRFPESLRTALETAPVPRIPDLGTPTSAAAGPAADAPATGEGGKGDTPPPSDESDNPFGDLLPGGG